MARSRARAARKNLSHGTARGRGLFACLFSFAATEAVANGRFPNAQELRETGPGSLVVSGTYGLLVSNNLKDFQLVCESTLFGKSAMGSWIDPLLEVLPDGTILSGSLSGIRVSRDRGCAFSSDPSLPHDAMFAESGSILGPLGSVVDLCPAYDDANAVIALTSMTDTDGATVEHRLYRSSIGARSWSPIGSALPLSMVRVVFTVDVAPSDPQQIYVSGSLLGASVLAVSEDGGASFAAHTLLAEDTGIRGLYIAAVSASDPKRVYLRASRQTQTEDGATTWDDSLLVSEDGGLTAHEVLRRQAALLGFALAPDGKTVLAGYGDPVVAPVVVNDAALGLYAATPDTLDFKQTISDFSVSCLRWTTNGLYAGAKERDPLAQNPTVNDFHVGRFQGRVPTRLSDFEPLAKLKDVRGPLPLASRLPSACQAEWASGDSSVPGQASVCATLNACDGSAVPLSPGAVVCGAPASVGPGASGGSSAGGVGGALEASPAGNGARAVASPSGRAGACSFCSRRAPLSGVWYALSLLIALRRSRRVTGRLDESGAGRTSCPANLS